MMTLATPGGSRSVPSLESRYELGETLGAGAMGVVYAALDTVLGVEVAVKILRSEHASSSEHIARFAREARVATSMLSPHIVKVLGLAVTSAGLPCIVYERLTGETLAARLERRTSLTVAETVDIVKQTALALSRAHALGVVHRDVKPDNIFLVPQANGRSLVKLIDFGIADVVDARGNGTSVLAGAPEYIAPELMAGRCADARVDLYALGVVAFECLTGRCPFAGDDIGAVYDLISRGERPTLHDLRPDLHGELNDWMERALYEDPYWRFASAKELSTALSEAMLAQPARIFARDIAA